MEDQRAEVLLLAVMVGGERVVRALDVAAVLLGGERQVDHVSHPLGNKTGSHRPAGPRLDRDCKSPLSGLDRDCCATHPPRP